MLDRLVDFFLTVLDKFYFLTIVDECERGVLLRFGKYVKDLSPGLHFRIPFGVDKVLTNSVVYDTMTFIEKVITLSDGITVSYGVTCAYTVEDIKAFLLQVEGAESALVDSVVLEIPKVLTSRTFSELQDPVVMEEVNKILLRLVRTRARRFGIKLEQIAITNVAKAKVLMLIKGAAG